MTQPKRRAAKRPAARTVHVVLEGQFEGWEATAKADFRASYLADLMGGDIGAIIHVLDEIVTEHNLPTAEDTIAERMGDVDPYDGLMQVAGAIFDAMGKLPNR